MRIKDSCGAAIFVLMPQGSTSVQPDGSDHKMDDRDQNNLMIRKHLQS